MVTRIGELPVPGYLYFHRFTFELRTPSKPTGHRIGAVNRLLNSSPVAFARPGSRMRSSVTQSRVGEFSGILEAVLEKGANSVALLI